MSVNVSLAYISCGCNRTPHAADWAENGQICFASDTSVTIFKSSDAKDDSSIESSEFVHKDRITSVRWIRCGDKKLHDAFVSTSADKTAALCSLKDNRYTVESILTGHGDAVTISDGIIWHPGYTPKETEIVVATASVDSTVKIWRRNLDTGNLESQVAANFDRGFALDVRLVRIVETVLLACATDDRKIHLFAPGESGAYSKVHSIIGHEDWVRSIDFIWKDDCLLLASGSQDSFVRIHKLRISGDGSNEYQESDLEMKETLFCVGSRKIGISLETVLMGHENWVYGVSFNISKKTGDLQLLTVSMDKSLVVWTPQDGLWVESARVGEVGGNTLGFYGGKLSSDGKGLMAHGYQGSFHLWRQSQDGLWEPHVVPGGHLGQVVDFCWAPSGRYLLSVGTDQTTRLHAPWKRNGENAGIWREIARPQVHGHDMSCISAISDTAFVSGSEEKVLRVFKAPKNFISNFKRICGVDVSDNLEGEAPEGASVPALGLSNKPVFQDVGSGEAEPDLYFSPVTLDRPPTEEVLLQNTLWPEVQKLYGHGYEIHTVATSPDGCEIASACHAANVEHSAVILWDTATWCQKKKLPFHRLTVTQMAYSPDSSQLVTVSRDRSWALYRNGSLAFTSGEKTPHTRIIWCCAWHPNSKVFSTGSRDGVICIWDALSGSCLTQLKLKECVTALAFSPLKDNQETMLLAGTESGQINILSWTDGSLTQVQDFKAHASTVTRIHFRPSNSNEFASSSKDHSLRIFRFNH